jgi:hypothetical protein
MIGHIMSDPFNKNKVKPVNLNVAIVHVKKFKKTKEFTTITEVLAFQKNNKIWDHTEVISCVCVCITCL